MKKVTIAPFILIIVSELTELAPGILQQLGPNAIMKLQEMARSYQAKAQAAGMSLDELAELAKGHNQGDDDVPDLVKSFEAADIDAN